MPMERQVKVKKFEVLKTFLEPHGKTNLLAAFSRWGLVVKPKKKIKKDWKIEKSLRKPQDPSLSWKDIIYTKLMHPLQSEHLGF